MTRRSARFGASRGERQLPDGGYCFNCRVGFESEHYANTHYALTGHEIGWPFEDVDWPLFDPSARAAGGEGL